jgi:hypothetical protein
VRLTLDEDAWAAVMTGNDNDRFITSTVGMKQCAGAA